MLPRHIKICRAGTFILELFLASTTLLTAGLIRLLMDDHGRSLFRIPGFYIMVILVALGEFLVFWAGIILVYASSLQLGVKKRLIGALCGWIPLVNLFALVMIIGTCRAEVAFEKQLAKRDEKRAGDQVCRTRYPLLLVHGVFFRDFEHLNYWGRIPEELKKNGAEIYYGEHNSASPVAGSARELEKRILDIVRETGCGKVNIIAHSKGGLDARAAIALTEAGPYVASLTTINTPHRGCEFADYLLSEIPAAGQQAVADTYNKAAARLGDHDPDFLSAVKDLTAGKCRERNGVIKDSPDVYYQSVGSVLRGASSGQFPLNYTYHLVKYFDGENDGLVGAGSFKWGESFRMVPAGSGKRGISHGDVIDLNRENIPGFDVREFYVQLVKDLKERGF